jgi:ribosomal protein L16/L10AE
MLRRPRRFKFQRGFRAKAAGIWSLHSIQQWEGCLKTKTALKLNWALFELIRLRLAWGLAKKKRQSRRLQFKHKLHKHQKIEKTIFSRAVLSKQQAFWYQGFPQRSYTAKARGARMGKGKGYIKQWYQPIASGTVILKLRYNNFFRLQYVLKQIARYLPGYFICIIKCIDDQKWNF